LPKDAETDLLMTADLLIEDIDFRLEWTSPELLGLKALAVSLSDIAAMGGEATAAMLSIGVPTALWEGNFLDRFYDGWFELARQFEVELVGGDVSRSPDRLVIDSIAIGLVARGKALLRSTAKSGDTIFVSGMLGGAAGGLRLLESGSRLMQNDPSKRSDLMLRQLHVMPELSLAKYLMQHNIASSAIDVSDGLSSDLRHICDASGVGARIEVDRLPVNDQLHDIFTPQVCEDLVLNGGEDFVLLFTTSDDKIDWPAELSVTKIGQITANQGQIELIRNGRSEIITPKGFRHF
jgi:thiamine-monophosphate kinase